LRLLWKLDRPPAVRSGQITARAMTARFKFQTAKAVIASEAKQSIAPLAEEWIASSLSLLAMTTLKSAHRAGFKPKA
jgi:hypothetical protein